MPEVTNIAFLGVWQHWNRLSLSQIDQECYCDRPGGVRIVQKHLPGIPLLENKIKYTRADFHFHLCCLLLFVIFLVFYSYVSWSFVFSNCHVLHVLICCFVLFYCQTVDVYFSVFIFLITIVANILCYDMFPYFSYICWSLSVINKGSEGPDLVDFLGVPKMFQKILESIRELKLAILE